MSEPKVFEPNPSGDDMPKYFVTAEPLDLNFIEATVDHLTGLERALLAEVKRLRAVLADVWDEGYGTGRGDEAEYDQTTPNPYRDGAA